MSMPLISRVVAILVIASSTAEGQTADTLGTRGPLFTAKDAAMLGGFTLATAAIAPVDKYLTVQLRQPARQANRLLNRSATGFRIFGHPGTLIIGTSLYVVGRIDGQRRVQDLGLHSVEALLLSAAVTGSIKSLAGRARPYVDSTNSTSFSLGRGFKSDDYRSFPSGHTALAFAFASVVSSETVRWWPQSRWLVGSVMYGGATLSGLSRIYDNQHWASDVVMGAAIGTLTGLKVYRYQHSHPDNKLDKTLLRAGIEISNNGSWMPLLAIGAK
ncbi:MAG TPA: phosphatase PAP2 family protein [Gemmatimonadaceae bacterium]|nr:phosphatase PAP2 family protein [Gemmatimonadaceae bacterium]